MEEPFRVQKHEKHEKADFDQGLGAQHPRSSQHIQHMVLLYVHQILDIFHLFLTLSQDQGNTFSSMTLLFNT